MGESEERGIAILNFPAARVCLFSAKSIIGVKTRFISEKEGNTPADHRSRFAGYCNLLPNRLRPVPPVITPSPPRVRRI